MIAAYGGQRKNKKKLTMNLHEYFLKNNGKLIHKWIHYFDIYERHFRRFVGEEMLIIEIGVFEGGSIQMWKEYFGEKATIVGIDIDPNCKQYEDTSRNIFVEIGSQSDTEFLKSIIEKYGRPDILLDDGSHNQSDIITSFENLYYQVKDDGVYFVEDLHTAYWPQYEGGLKLETTFIEYAKNKIDQLNGNWFENGLNDFTKLTQSISAYDSIVVFEKRVQGYRMHIKTAAMK
jgi:hypothetical protein